MSAAQVEELVDETTLQDLDWAPPCELEGVHKTRGVPVCAADEAVKIQPPCGCESPQTVLMCLGCDQFLSATTVGVCSVCRVAVPWPQVVIERVPL